jgi:hypothetical protein
VYDKYFNELVSLCKLIGVAVNGEKSEAFDLENLGNYDPLASCITLYFEDTFKMTASTLFTLAHEFRHAFQYKTDMFPEYWHYVCGYGVKPDTSLKDALEADADRYATFYLKGRGIRIPKDCKTDC